MVEVERDSEGRVMICTGCGTVETVASIRRTHPTAFTCCPERKMVRATHSIDASAARHSVPRSSDGSGAEPVAYLHVMHMEGGQTYERLSDWDGIDEDEPKRTAFGIPGRDYSETYPVTTTPLYAHPAPGEPAAQDHIAKLKAALRDIAEAELIPTPEDAFQFCRDVAREALS